MELWKDIEGYSGRYQISNHGRVKSIDRIVQHKRGPRKWKGRYLKLYTHLDYPYPVVNLSKDGLEIHISVHRLVALAFIPNHLNLECVNHIDGNPKNNIYTNLEWCTRGENIKHAHRTGLMPNNKGSKRYNSKLTEQDIPVIKGLYKHLGLRLCQIAPMYQVNRMLIRQIIDNKKWAHVQ